MQIVVFKVMTLSVNVSKDIMETHSLDVVRNALLTVIVLRTWLVEIRNVKIHVLEFVELKLFVQSIIMFQFVRVQKVQLEMLSDIVPPYQNTTLQ
jgi:hypothetical protein